MSTVISKDLKQHAPFESRCISPRLLNGHRRTDFECGVVGSGFGPIEADVVFLPTHLTEPK